MIGPATIGTRAVDGRSCKILHTLGWHLPDLSDFCFRLTIRGDPVSLKNSKRAVHAKGRMLFISSAKVTRWMGDAGLQLRSQWGRVFREPLPLSARLNARIVSYLPTRRLSDASNLYQAPEDALQKFGVITDDSQIEAHDGSHRGYDRDNPRVDIELRPWFPGKHHGET